jgi:hypothetical protein
MEKQKWVIIEGKRYNLANMEDLGICDKRWGTGLSLEAVYMMRRSKAVIIHTYSLWQDGNHSYCVGDQYRVASEGDISRLAEIFGGKLVELVPVAVDE